MLVLMSLLFVFLMNSPVGGLAGSSVPLEVEQLIRKAFEDHSWLSLKTEKDVRSYCEAIYCEEILGEVTGDIIDFISCSSDWHSVVLVQDMVLVEEKAEELQVLVWISYFDLNYKDGMPVYSISGEETILIHLKEKEEGNYKIARIERVTETPQSIARVGN